MIPTFPPIPADSRAREARGTLSGQCSIIDDYATTGGPGTSRSRAHGLEPAHVLHEGDLGREALHARRAEEPDHAGGAGEHVLGVVRLGDGPPVAEHDDVG